jgi:hypothetical protein
LASTGVAASAAAAAVWVIRSRLEIIGVTSISVF